MDWISMKDRPIPRDENRYIVYERYHGDYGEVQCTKGWAASSCVTHWMPMPGPPKEG